MYKDHIYKWLENALSYGLTEVDFWSMTLAEIDRAIKAKQQQERRKAEFDYILADLIGASVARIFNKSNSYPTIAQAYPSLFDRVAEEEEIQKKKDMLSAIRFKQFALSHNKKFGGDK